MENTLLHPDILQNSPLSVLPSSSNCFSKALLRRFLLSLVPDVLSQPFESNRVVLNTEILSLNHASRGTRELFHKHKASLCSFRGELRAVISWFLSPGACSLSHVFEASFVQLPRLGQGGGNGAAARGARRAHEVGIGTKGQQHMVLPGAERTARRTPRGAEHRDWRPR